MIYYRKQYFDSIVAYGMFDEKGIKEDGTVETEEYVIHFIEHSDQTTYHMGGAYLYDYEVAHLMLLDHNNSTNLTALTRDEYIEALKKLQDFDELNMKAQGILKGLLGVTEDAEKNPQWNHYDE